MHWQWCQFMPTSSMLQSKFVIYESQVHVCMHEVCVCVWGGGGVYCKSVLKGFTVQNKLKLEITAEVEEHVTNWGGGEWACNNNIIQNS